MMASRATAIPAPNGTSTPRFNHDWTRKPSEDLTPFQRFTRDDVDWAKSPLGPPETWCSQLRHMALLIMADPSPAVMYWGHPSLAAALYNEACVPLIGSKHPELQGQLARIELKEIWDQFNQLLHIQLEDGQTKVHDVAELLLDRHGFLEESYFSYKFMPLISPEVGTYVGSYATVTEHTIEVLLKRRVDTIKHLGSVVSQTTDLSDLWKAIIGGLEFNGKDIPLAMLYSAHNSHVPTTRKHGPIFSLQGTLGIEEGHKAAPLEFSLDDHSYDLAPLFKKASDDGAPVLVELTTEALPPNLFNNTQPRGYSEACRAIVVCPIRRDTSGATIGFLLIGLNPHRPYDTPYQDFIRLIVEAVTTPWSAQILLHEQLEAKRLAEAEAQLQRLALDQQLAAKQAAFENSELKFSRVCNRLPVGIGIADSEGNILYGNPAWRRFVQVEEGSTEPFSFMHCVRPEEEETIWQMWTDLTAGRSVNSLLRLNARWTTPDGVEEPMTVLVCAWTDFDKDGDSTTMMSCLTDVSELKWIQSQLLERTADLEHSELKYRKFADLAPIGVCILDQDRLLEYANQSFLAIMAHSTPSIDIITSIHTDDAELFRSQLAALSEEQASVTFECRLAKHSAPPTTPLAPKRVPSDELVSQQWILVSAHLELEPKTHIICWVTDITGQKAAQNVIQRRMEEALETKRQQENFIDMTSHEMRNPLSALIHCTDEIIENCHARPEGHIESSLEAAYTIEYCAKHIRNIIGDVLTLSKLDSKLIEILPTPVRPRAMVQEAMKIFTSEARAEDIELTYIEDDSMNTLNIDWVLLDPNRVLQVLFNLVTNAIKFTRALPERKISIRLIASAEVPSADTSGIAYVPRRTPRNSSSFDEDFRGEESVYLAIAVKDTGLGLTEQEKNLLFTRFKQASPKTETKYGGSGLGLFISRDLTELQGGEIGVRSSPGVGSEFVFYVETKRIQAPEHAATVNIPEITMRVRPSSVRLSPSARALAQGRSSANKAAKAPDKSLQVPAEEPAAIKPKKILIVEDNLINQKVLAKQLRKRGYDVATAEHGQEALKSLYYTHQSHDSSATTATVSTSATADATTPSSSAAFDLALMDIEMPVMDGITCVKEIRAAEARGDLPGHLPVIAVTANARAEQTDLATAAGVDGVTTKPYRMDDLVAKIERICAERAAQNS